MSGTAERVVVLCDYCGADLYVHPTRLTQQAHFFCDLGCMNLARADGDWSPNRNGKRGKRGKLVPADGSLTDEEKARVASEHGYGSWEEYEAARVAKAEKALGMRRRG